MAILPASRDGALETNKGSRQTQGTHSTGWRLNLDWFATMRALSIESTSRTFLRLAGWVTSYAAVAFHEIIALNFLTMPASFASNCSRCMHCGKSDFSGLSVRLSWELLTRVALPLEPELTLLIDSVGDLGRWDATGVGSIAVVVTDTTRRPRNGSVTGHPVTCIGLWAIRPHTPQLSLWLSCPNSTTISTAVRSLLEYLFFVLISFKPFLDLYGADDNEFAVKEEPEPATSTPEDVKTSAKEKTPPPTVAPPTQLKQESPAVEVKPIISSVSSTAPAPAPIPTYGSSTGPSVQSPPPVSNGTPYSAQVAQQYSTYNHSQYQDHQYEHSEIQQIDTTGERSNINVVDRSVRPSEMRDEGWVKFLSCSPLKDWWAVMGCARAGGTSYIVLSPGPFCQLVLRITYIHLVARVL